MVTGHIIEYVTITFLNLLLFKDHRKKNTNHEDRSNLDSKLNRLSASKLQWDQYLWDCLSRRTTGINLSLIKMSETGQNQGLYILKSAITLGYSSLSTLRFISLKALTVYATSSSE